MPTRLSSRELFLPVVAENVRVTHQAAAEFHYFTLTGAMPFLEDYARIGIDIRAGLRHGKYSLRLPGE